MNHSFTLWMAEEIYARFDFGRLGFVTANFNQTGTNLLLYFKLELIELIEEIYPFTRSGT